MVAQQRIIQIIPADGWLAVYDTGAGDVRNLRTVPLACWALVERDGMTSVIGMDAEHVAGQSPAGRFLGYMREGEPLSRLRERPNRPG